MKWKVYLNSCRKFLDLEFLNSISRSPRVLQVTCFWVGSNRNQSVPSTGLFSAALCRTRQPHDENMRELMMHVAMSSINSWAIPIVWFWLIYFVVDGGMVDWFALVKVPRRARNITGMSNLLVFDSGYLSSCHDLEHCWEIHIRILHYFSTYKLHNLINLFSSFYFFR